MTKLKICGITDLLNAKELCALNINFLGLIFTQSPRKVSKEQAKVLTQIIHQHQKAAVGVFGDEDDEFILTCVDFCHLDGVQIHKQSSKALYEKLQAKKVFLWQVISVGEKLELQEEIFADKLLFDTKGKFKGGNGLSFDWNLLKDYKKDFILAGGIGLENIKQALKLKPEIIDINSKIEDKPGLKNVEKIQKIIEELK